MLDPGVACQSLGPLGPLKNDGVVVGIHLKPQEQNVKVPSAHCDERVQTVCADFMNIQRDKIRGQGFSVILSHICPQVSGITTRDAALSPELRMRALELAGRR